MSRFGNIKIVNVKDGVLFTHQTYTAEQNECGSKFPGHKFRQGRCVFCSARDLREQKVEESDEQ